ncbi:MAG TPA: hypothetical protein VGF93_22975 [Solirubrobacteraceae bacterium]|jgi:hypothetical protein
MTTDTLHPLAADYLERMRRAGRGLPAGRLRELLAEIEGHLSEAIDPSASDAQALTVLDRLGDPEAIIAAETPDSDELRARRGPSDWAAIILLLFGGFILGVGWFAGVVLLWSSRVWTTRDKWIGTLLLPGGLAPGVLVALFVLGGPAKEFCHGLAGGIQRCVNGGPSTSPTVLGVAACAVLILTPVATSVYLARRAA